MTRVGQIGLGAWGSRVLKTLATMPDVQIVWTASRGDWAHKLQQNAEKTDAVVICVPPDAQPVIAITVLEMGLSCFLEKPLALNIIEARRIHEAAAMRGLPVVVDHVWLFHPLFEWLKQELKEKQIITIECNSGDAGPVRGWPGEHAALWDWAGHDIAMVLDLNGPILDLQRAVLDKGIYHLNFHGQHAPHVEIGTGNQRTAKMRHVTVRTTTGAWTFDGTTALGVNDAPPLTKALTVWLQAVRGEAYDERVGTTLGLKVVQILEQAQEALITV
ncbi:MAG: Gfo/Idh/MocA family oxidoreductase [Acidobacteriota bacterium]|nr:Gfo/Idh/MocA family oxidoreductase [Acidobacteriota bacterium]